MWCLLCCFLGACISSSDIQEHGIAEWLMPKGAKELQLQLQPELQILIEHVCLLWSSGKRRAL